MWIERDISSILLKNRDHIQILRGPRQCGKTSLFLHLDQGFEELSLDDPSLRNLAQEDPELFLSQFKGKKIFIDEAQYAPILFPSIKRRVDLYKRSSKDRQTIFRLSASNQILMDLHVKESLAGRASYFDLNTLSVSEILSHIDLPIQEILFKGGWPELHADGKISTQKYLDNYINTYVEKDIILSAGIQKSREFLLFVRLLAGRVGQLLDFSNLAREIAIDGKTAKDWVSVLEKMGIIALVPSYSNNLSKRLIKSPKLYFLDTGLACRLQGWQDSRPILTSPLQGALFENLVFIEIHRTIINYQKPWRIFHWRSKDKEEIDFLIEKSPQEFLFIESKVKAQKIHSHQTYPEVRKVFPKKIPDLIMCHQEGERILGQNIPIAFLKHFLLDEV